MSVLFSGACIADFGHEVSAQGFMAASKDMAKLYDGADLSADIRWEARRGAGRGYCPRRVAFRLSRNMKKHR